LNNSTPSKSNILNVNIGSSDIGLNIISTNSDNNDNNTFDFQNINILNVDSNIRSPIAIVCPSKLGLDEDDNSILNNIISISDKLRSWVVKHNVSHSSVNSLLHILKTERLCVPNDVRTLMFTPKVHSIHNLSSGSYVHLGVENMLLPILKKHKTQYAQ